MAIDFPSNPSDGQTKTHNGKTWTYDSSTTSWIFTPSTFTETDPVVGAINGLIKADGDGNITNAVAGTDYLSSYTESDTLSDVLLRGNTTTTDITTTGKVYFANMFDTLGDLPSASTYHGMFAHVHATGKGYFAHSDSWVELANVSDIPTSTYTNSDVDTHLNKDASSDGKVLSWNQTSGVYAWIDASSGGTPYTDSDVNTHLNVSPTKPTDGYVLSWDATADNNNGDYAWVAQSSGGGSSLWSENGSELYRNSQVGIGDFSSTGPSSKLHIIPSDNEPVLNCGLNNTVSGVYSSALGSASESTATYSIAIGHTSKAWSDYSIAIGHSDTKTSTSSANNGTAIRSIAIGNNATTQGTKSLAFGNDVTSGGTYSTAMGRNITVSASYSFGIGLNNNSSTLNQSSTMAIMGGKVAIDTSKTNNILDDITEKLEVGGAIKIGTTSTASPTGGEIKYDSNDFFGHDGTEWKSLTSGGGGGGTLSSRTTFNTNTDMTTTDSKTLTVGASASGHITGFKSYSLLKINISQPDLWVTIYTDPTSMSNDASRLYTQDPNPSSGVIAEFITDSNNSGQDIIITPTVIGFNAESTPADKIYLKVSNIGSSNQTSDFIIQMTVLQLEA